jgi:hypothetical protein
MFGLGAALCVTVVGCNEIDKPKLGGTTKQPGPGLPGTPTLSGQPGSGNVRGGQPGMGTQPLGGVGTPVGRSPAGSLPVGGNTNFAAGSGSGGNAFVPSVSPSNLDPAPVSPAAGMGTGAATGSFGGAAAPSLDAPGLTPPASPGAAGAAVLPPGYGPVAPTQR